MPNKDLQKIIDDLKTKKFRDGEAKGLMSQISKELLSQFGPAMDNLSKGQVEAVTKAIQDAVKGLKVDSPQVQIPEMQVPPVDTETIASAIREAISGLRVGAPIVNVPPISIPEIVFPNEMSTRGWAGIMFDDKKVGLDNPFPVTVRNTDGSPVDFSKFASAVIGGSSGKADYLTIKGFGASAFAGLQNPDGYLKVMLPTGSSGLTDTELRASHIDVQQLSGSIDSVYITGSAASSILGEVTNPDGRLKVELPTGSSGLTDTELRATAIPVSQVSGSSYSVNVLGTAVVSATDLDIRDLVNASDSVSAYQVSGHAWSVSVSDVFGSTGTNIVNPDGRLKVELPSGASGLTDTELRASALQTIQLSGASYSVNIINPVDNGDAATAIRTVQAGNSVSSVIVNDFVVTVPVYQVSGAAFSVNNIGPIAQGDSATALRVVVAGNSDASVVVNSGTITSITNTVPIVQVSGNSDSVNVLAFNGNTPATGLNETNAGVLRVVQMTDSISSVNVVSNSGTTAAVYTRQANPTAVVSDYVPFAADDLGRQLIRPIQVRDLIKTAYVSVTNGTETTLLAGVAGAFLDCISIMCSNNSDAAVSVDIRAVTAGNVLHTIRIPANATAGWVPQVPWPQDATGNNWTVDGPDETGRTLTFSALFSQEI
jgi:hypothetical protein